MPGSLLSVSAVVTCAHGGLARAVQPFPRVLLGGEPAVNAGGPYTVAGCPLPAESGGPCVSAQWVTVAARVRLGGKPAVLNDSRSTCTPTGTPLTVVRAQARVKGS
jgi:hypothetical protein